MSERFDVVVLGGGLSATLTAALLAKRGLRGLLVDEGELTTTEQRRLVDMVASDEGSLAIQTVHRELGVGGALRARADEAQPLQFILPDARLDLWRQRERLLGELARDLPAVKAEAFFNFADEVDGDVAGFLSRVGELPATGFFGRRGVRSLAFRYGAAFRPLSQASAFRELPQELQEMLLAAQAFLTNFYPSGPEKAIAARVIRPLMRLVRGVRVLDGGDPLRPLLIHHMERQAFELRRARVEGLSIEPDAITLRLPKERSPVRAQILIDATAQLSGLAKLKGAPPAVAKALSPLKSVGRMHSLGFELDQAAVPPGLGGDALLAGAAPDGPMWLSTRPAGQPGRVHMLASLPVQGEVDAEALNERMRTRLLALLPFFMDGHPAPTPIASETDKIPGGYPVPQHPLLSDALDPATGLTGLPVSGLHPQLLVGGPSVLPGLGIEGEYTTALQAADLCEERCRPNSPKRKRRLDQRGA